MAETKRTTKKTGKTSTKRAAKKKLVIVESPTKVDSVKKYLGSAYNIEATMGHLRDLPKSQMGVDIEHDFEPKYITIRGKGELIAKLKKKAKAADKIYLATDPDREGEAISWHLANILNIDPGSECRITFNEVTKNAVKEAVKDARPIDMDLVDAQQARRVLDRIVGYEISPLLWKKVKKGLSAGRVQSVVTRLVVDREREIEAFDPKEYWSIDLKLTNDKGKLPFGASFYGSAAGKKIALENEEDTTKIAEALKTADYTVTKITKKETKRRSAPPFTTSTMQQEASRKLNFTTRRTMVAAQQLYEMGYITYMRTDSLRIAAVAQNEARAFIADKYGDSFVPPTPKVYRAKKSAQDAHEAIRPTFAANTPESLKEKLKADHYKLYRLIWMRFIASQMSDAVLDTVNAEICADDYMVKANGSSIKFAGFMTLYVEGKDEAEENDKITLKLNDDGEVIKAYLTTDDSDDEDYDETGYFESIKSSYIRLREKKSSSSDTNDYDFKNDDSDDVNFYLKPSGSSVDYDEFKDEVEDGDKIGLITNSDDEVTRVYIISSSSSGDDEDDGEISSISDDDLKLSGVSTKFYIDDPDDVDVDVDDGEETIKDYDDLVEAVDEDRKTAEVTITYDDDNYVTKIEGQITQAKGDLQSIDTDDRIIKLKFNSGNTTEYEYKSNVKIDLRYYSEDDPFLTDLFPEEMCRDTFYFIFYLDDHTLDRYLELKREKTALLEKGEYDVAHRREIAFAYGKMLSYSDEGIERLLGKTAQVKES